jgi:hypothetical protein
VVIQLRLFKGVRGKITGFVLDASVADTENLANYFLKGQHGGRLGRLSKKSGREQDADFLSVKASLEQWIVLVRPLGYPYCSP